MKTRYSAEQMPLPVSHDRDSSDTPGARLVDADEAIKTLSNLAESWSELSGRDQKALSKAIAAHGEALRDLTLHLDPTAFPSQLVRLGEFKERLVDHASGLSPTSRRSLVRRTREAMAVLEDLLEALDPIAQPRDRYNPGSPDAFAEAIVARMHASEPLPLEELSPFYGSGIYALYYSGQFPAYVRISGKDIPIYVGKAEPEKPDAELPIEQGTSLFDRLRKHRKSIVAAADHAEHTLDVAHFSYRYLALDSAWQGAAENLLIRRFKPVWNKETNICDGFGKNGDSYETRSNSRSEWGTLHPGRRWETDPRNKANGKTREEIINDILEHCARHYADEFETAEPQVHAPHEASDVDAALEEAVDLQQASPPEEEEPVLLKKYAE